MRRSRAVLAVLLCLAPAYALATETWMTVMLDGRKVGKLKIDREATDKQVTTAQVLDFRLTRIKTPLALRTELRSVESTHGQPLGFYAKSSMSSQENLVEGQVRDDGAFQVANTVGGQSRVNLLIWPTGAALVEGQRLNMVRMGFRPGTTYQTRNFDPVKQQVATVDVLVVGDEVVDLPQSRETLHHIRQTLAGSNNTQFVDMWVNDQGDVRRGIAPLLGFRMEMAACDAACANAPDQDVDLLRAAMVDAPRPMTPSLRAAPVRYMISIHGNHPSPFIETDEQHVHVMGDGLYQVDVGWAVPRSGEPGPTTDDTAPNPWVQSESPEVIALARRVVGDAPNDLQRMRRLRSFLSDYINEKGLDVGYASALETIHSRKGDCTEHAVLLTALARALGIPARVVTGIVYVDRFGGASRVFVPHAWTQAWLGNRWVSFDSAQRRFDATHIALGTGSGDPWRFFQAMSVLGNIRIERATAASSLMDMPAPSMSDSFVGGGGSGKGAAGGIE
ncbi:transglutaminase domain-containing protein [Luteibacter pinisoli]|uniref:Transglutaminase domain-containing protein n=1 Tax=Luteibacter pinisoli TaxID=2589080 RepID=A0A4Y5Z1L5_9GAMM|nr:transglutaminase-like domain-containing protein [Luteibacter pinisoli]QDE38756.1 transglutaminase domain-containing protein [Luteibacter pinisoli]